jgi:hypothetical protein
MATDANELALPSAISSCYRRPPRILLLLLPVHRVAGQRCAGVDDLLTAEPNTGRFAKLTG